MPLGKNRDKVLQGVGKARGRAHRYTVYRWIVGIAFTLSIAALPAFDLLRFDLWGGHHAYLGRELGLVAVAKAFAFQFLAINLAIIVASRLVGRYLCGFVCPYGSVARLVEWFRYRSKSRARRVTAALAVVAVCTLLAVIAFSFWIDWRVFRDGSPLAITIAGATLLATSATFVVMVRSVGLDFCRKWCPSGVYFALLGEESRNGVEFAHPSACTDCNACEKVCPMDLTPRHVPDGAPREGVGFYPDRASNLSLCIRCGDCVNVCEATTARSGDLTPLRLGFLRERGADSAELSAVE